MNNEKNSQMEILGLVSLYLARYPSNRFGQALYNLDIMQFDGIFDAHGLQKLRVIKSDSDEDVVKRTLVASEKFGLTPTLEISPIPVHQKILDKIENAIKKYPNLPFVEILHMVNILAVCTIKEDGEDVLYQLDIHAKEDNAILKGAYYV